MKPPSSSSSGSPATPSVRGSWTSSRTGCTAAPIRCPSAPPTPRPPPRTPSPLLRDDPAAAKPGAPGLDSETWVYPLPPHSPGGALCRASARCSRLLLRPRLRLSHGQLDGSRAPVQPGQSASALGLQSGLQCGRASFRLLPAALVGAGSRAWPAAHLSAGSEPSGGLERHADHLHLDRTHLVRPRLVPPP